MFLVVGDGGGSSGKIVSYQRNEKSETIVTVSLFCHLDQSLALLTAPFLSAMVWDVMNAQNEKPGGSFPKEPTTSHSVLLSPQIPNAYPYQAFPRIEHFPKKVVTFG